MTARGQAGVAIVRISGTRTKAVVQQISPISARIFAEPRKVFFGPIYQGNWQDSELIDEGLIVFFPTPKSYTGEDVAEVHLHGSDYLVRTFLETLGSLGVRMARPGEFTERAYQHGKIDLSQAEAVADLIAAETALQARVAREQLSGKLSEAVTRLGEPLRDLLAEIEANIDFPEEDINPKTAAEWERILTEELAVVREYLATFRTGKICREGALVVLAGAPNAGKSSLLNRLLGEDRAIVTPLPGTTRDSIEEAAEIDGLRIRFCDTAGLLDSIGSRTPDEVEKLGIERSWKKLEQADLCLYVFDSSAGWSGQETLFNEVKKRSANVLILANKVDLLHAGKRHKSGEGLPGPSVSISAKSGEGLEKLRSKIAEITAGPELRSASLLVTNQRHFDSLKWAADALEHAVNDLATGAPAEFVSVHIRAALGALEDIVGATPTEEILGRIFSKFCIGK